MAVFGVRPLPPWRVCGFYDGPRCVAGLQVGILHVSWRNQATPVAALRNVAVASDWRGNGLMRDLLEQELPRLEAAAAAVLLFAETAELYTRFGFEPVLEHAFVGPAPEPVGDGGALPVDAGRDAALLARLVATRSTVSALCAIEDDAGLTAHALASGRWPMHYHAGLNALIVGEETGDRLVIVDVLAPRIPSAARILGALGMRSARLETLFSPDRLEWRGEPVAVDAGLMLRGSRPPGMRQAFMLPPTVEF